MGLDGISINQLRADHEHINTELMTVQTTKESRVVSGLSEDQRISSNKDKEHNQQNGSESSKKDEEENEDEESLNFDFAKIDLSESSKYELIMNEEANTISIIEKKSNKVVHVIDADNLAVFVKYLSNATGAIINRKF